MLIAKATIEVASRARQTETWYLSTGPWPCSALPMPLLEVRQPPRRRHCAVLLSRVRQAWCCHP